MQSIETFVGCLFLATVIAGPLGTLVGWGGGVLIIPLLTIFTDGFDLGIRLAVSASIVQVIATSSGAGVTLIRDGLANVHVASLLLVATSIRAVAGALIAPQVPVPALFILFRKLRRITVVPMLRKVGQVVPGDLVSHPLALRLLPSSFPDRNLDQVNQAVASVPTGFSLLVVAEIVSELQGIGSEGIKVPMIDSAVRLPVNDSAAAINVMMTVMATSVGISGGRPPLVAAPVVCLALVAVYE